MARSRTKDVVLEIPGFYGGVNTWTDPDKLRPFEARIIEDMELDSMLGRATKRLGVELIDSFGAAGNRVLSLHVFYRAGNTTQIIRHTSDGVIAYSTNFGDTWTNITTGLSTTAPFAMETFNNKVYMTNGTDNYRWWSGSAAGNSGTAPKGKYLQVWKDIMWVSGVTATPDRVLASNAGDAETFGASAWVDINVGRGGGNTGLAADANALIVFKARETHALYDPVEFTNRIVDFQKGCLSHFSIILHDGVIYFWSYEGICAYLGDAPNFIISDAIRPLWDFPSLYDITLSQHIWGYTFGGKVGWTFPQSSISDYYQIEWHARQPEKPWVFQQMPVRNAVVVQENVAAATGERLICGHHNSNKVLRAYTQGQDDSVTFGATIAMGWFDMEQPWKTKYLHRLRVYGRGSFSIDVYKDFDEDTAVKTLSFVGSGAEDLEKDFDLDIYARQFSLRFYDTAVTTTQTIEAPIGDELESATLGGWTVAKAVVGARVLGDRRGG